MKVRKIHLCLTVLIPYSLVKFGHCSSRSLNYRHLVECQEQLTCSMMISQSIGALSHAAACSGRVADLIGARRCSSQKGPDKVFECAISS